jgi:hypothetical protein
MNNKISQQVKNQFIDASIEDEAKLSLLIQLLWGAGEDIFLRKDDVHSLAGVLEQFLERKNLREHFFFQRRLCVKRMANFSAKLYISELKQKYRTSEKIQ